MDKQNFIRTSDESTATILISQGFVCIEQNNGVWTFLNDTHLKFDDSVKNISYTNIINM